jgi:hypothetical protein
MGPLRASGRVAAPLLAAVVALAGCDRDPPDDALGQPRAHEVVRVAPAEEALGNAVVATLDPETMNDAEIRQGLRPGRQCLFRYTSTGKPVLAVGVPADGQGTGGVVKLNGHLVLLAADPSGEAGDGSLRLGAGPVRITLSPGPAPSAAREGDGGAAREADMVFEVADRLKVGYRGYLGCVTTR